MTVRKKLQKLGNSRVLLLDRDLLEALLPDGALDAVLLVEVVGGALVVRREGAEPLSEQAVSDAAARPPLVMPGLSPTEQRVLDALRRGSATRGELAEVVSRKPETVSAALKRLAKDEWVTQTGRDWRLTPHAKRRLETDEGKRYAELPPSLARLVLALEAGPLTAREVADTLGVPRSTANAMLVRGGREGVVTMTIEGNVPHYSLRGQCHLGSSMSCRRER